MIWSSEKSINKEHSFGLPKGTRGRPFQSGVNNWKPFAERNSDRKAPIINATYAYKFSLFPFFFSVCNRTQGELKRKNDDFFFSRRAKMKPINKLGRANNFHWTKKTFFLLSDSGLKKSWLTEKKTLGLKTKFIVMVCTGYCSFFLFKIQVGCRNFQSSCCVDWDSRESTFFNRILLSYGRIKQVFLFHNLKKLFKISFYFLQTLIYSTLQENK